ncbi:hypothetical protein BDV95DRAFT_591364 [Massariosphaeria phaeospora]|uniref:Uncharacterized protein n=1 Tax=Massariosphaeria phaeospora TaxID=100035 RepID=A0A7C8ME23_9PLEO|nr:hypothetical protein BDV95DRAFT_591364 [Massariosphaeria phaeospora]
MGDSCGSKGTSGSGSVACAGGHAIHPEHSLVKDKNHIIVSPSGDDFASQKSSKQYSLEEWKRRIELRSQDMDSNPIHKSFVEKALTEVDTLLPQIIYLDELPEQERVIGTLFACSGPRSAAPTSDEQSQFTQANTQVRGQNDWNPAVEVSVPEWLLNWTLTTIDAPRSVDNYNPFFKVDIVHPHTSSRFLEGTSTDTYCRLDQLTTRRGAKNRRTSGWFKGMINGVPSILSGDFVGIPGKAVRCWTMGELPDPPD